MITLIVAIAAGCGAFAGTFWGLDFGWGWSVFCGVVGFGACQVVLGLLVQKRLKRDMEGVQGILLAGQKRTQEKVQRWQIRPPGSLQAAKNELFGDTKVFVSEAIAKTSVLEKYRPWVPLFERQLATIRLQLYWMIRDWRNVDALMPKVVLLDPTVSAMKMARMFMLEKPTDEIRKVYEKAAGRVKYNGNVLLAATMSWIQVRRDDADGAFKTLTAALKKSDNETLKRNHELLMNNRVAHFNNSGIGDPWYSLQLEEPKVKAQRQRSVFR